LITSEELKKFTKLTTQEAWRQEQNTTLNDMVEYICFRVCDRLLECLVEIKGTQEEILDRVDNLELINITNKEEQNASKDGGLQKSQRSKKAGA